MSAQLKVLKWMVENPGWRYAPEIARGSNTSDTLVYLRLEGLQEFGFVESRPDPSHDPPPNYQQRHHYRATLHLGKTEHTKGG